MNLLQKMQENKSNFTKNDLKIYDKIISDPGGIAFMSTTDLAEHCGVSQPAVTRFIKSLGYEKFQDFRAELVSYLAKYSDNAEESKLRQPYFTRLFATIESIEQTLTKDYMEELAKYVLKHKRLFVVGRAKSRYPAELFAVLVRKIGLVATVLDIHEAPGVSNLMEKEDLMIFFSANGQPEIFKQILTDDGDLMIVTAAYSSNKMRHNDKLVKLPYITKNPEESSISPIGFSIFVELLVSYIIKLQS